ncbi:hypothetical protein RchiOBHm_Chr7g0229401 [Rosa chinensis]|uniref:Dienelactone hydrolase domain-containing protein n=1 Tax=Rosa chinensis TaxID=74649 RepID=A0A2P6PF65_ROSCH|nr:hypothetical protein RchiOBHm_Chr7g0229401 [Rosa chinensis]
MERFGKGFKDAKLAIDALTGKGFSATAAAGFYWDAKIVTKLAQSESIQAAVLLHPSFISVDEVFYSLKFLTIG